MTYREWLLVGIIVIMLFLWLYEFHRQAQYRAAYAALRGLYTVLMGQHSELLKEYYKRGTELQKLKEGKGNDNQDRT